MSKQQVKQAPATVAAVNKALREKYGMGAGTGTGTVIEGPAVVMYAGRGYYYFGGERGIEVASLYVYRISSMTVAQVLAHVEQELRGAL